MYLEKAKPIGFCVNCVNIFIILRCLKSLHIMQIIKLKLSNNYIRTRSGWRRELREMRWCTYCSNTGIFIGPALLQTQGSASPGSSLNSHKRLHASESLCGLIPYNVASDQSLKLHQPSQRLQRSPCLGICATETVGQTEASIRVDVIHLLQGNQRSNGRKEEYYKKTEQQEVKRFKRNFHSRARRTM